MPSLEKQNWIRCRKSDLAYSIQPNSCCMLATLAIIGCNQNASRSNSACLLGHYHEFFSNIQWLLKFISPIHFEPACACSFYFLTIWWLIVTNNTYSSTLVFFNSAECFLKNAPYFPFEHLGSLLLFWWVGRGWLVVVVVALLCFCCCWFSSLCQVLYAFKPKVVKLFSWTVACGQATQRQRSSVKIKSIFREHFYSVDWR